METALPVIILDKIDTDIYRLRVEGFIFSLQREDLLGDRLQRI